ncbi:hypothetical protein EGW08_009621, partial [Elysia chlorotica]
TIELISDSDPLGHVLRVDDEAVDKLQQVGLVGDVVSRSDLVQYAAKPVLLSLGLIQDLQGAIVALPGVDAQSRQDLEHLLLDGTIVCRQGWEE